jgi:glycerol uptake facilitator-like aquaporin
MVGLAAFGYIAFSVVGALIGLVILYLIIRNAVTAGMKEHTRWVTANRAEIDRKYGGKPGTEDA